MTGWRIGWVVGPPELIGAITAINQHSVTCAPTLSQRAALRAEPVEGEPPGHPEPEDGDAEYVVRFAQGIEHAYD